MDDHLGSVAVQHREVQGHESDTFRAYFKHGLMYVSQPWGPAPRAVTVGRGPLETSPVGWEQLCPSEVGEEGGGSGAGLHLSMPTCVDGGPQTPPWAQRWEGDPGGAKGGRPSADTVSVCPLPAIRRVGWPQA